MKKKYDFLIVGAGLFGSTFTWLARNAGKSCLVIDKREVPGGNIYCEVMDGIPVHKYGAHIFHTSNKKVWEFVNSFVEFNRYTNSPVAIFDNEVYNLPFNMNTFSKLWGIRSPKEALEIINVQRNEALLKMKQDGISEPQNLEEQALLLVGKDIYEKLIKGYTEKQWGRKCSELPAFIIKRLPVRMVYDNNYFNDTYQGIPTSHDGYNTLISKMIFDNAPSVRVELNTDFFSKSFDEWLRLAKHIIYTGPIDKLFNFCFGPLSYRTVRFDVEKINTPNFQGNAVVNYTNADIPYTRIIEHKHFIMFGDDVYNNPNTIISREFPCEFQEGMEPFYPINDSFNMELYDKYSSLTNKFKYLSVAGRLGQYKYFDMDKTIEEAFKLFDKIIGNDIQ